MDRLQHDGKSIHGLSRFITAKWSVSNFKLAFSSVCVYSNFHQLLTIQHKNSQPHTLNRSHKIWNRNSSRMKHVLPNKSMQLFFFSTLCARFFLCSYIFFMHSLFFQLNEPVLNQRLLILYKKVFFFLWRARFFSSHYKEGSITFSLAFFSLRKEPTVIRWPSIFFRLLVLFLASLKLQHFKLLTD